MTARAAGQTGPSHLEWFESWFDSEHYHRLYAHRDEHEAVTFIDRLVERLQPGAAAAILDLGCGSGRHARHLARQGFAVTGLDLSAQSLARAREGVGPQVRFRQHDMRVPFGSAAFDYVLSLFTSFGYFADPAEHVQVVYNIVRSLKPGGRLVLDYLNVQHAEAHLVPDEVTMREEVVYRLSRWSDANAICKRIVVDDPRSPTALEYTERVARLTLDMFRFMFLLCNLRIEEICGDYRMSPFDLATSPRLILVARKMDCERPQVICARGSCEFGSRSPASFQDTTPAWIAGRAWRSTDTP